MTDPACIELTRFIPALDDFQPVRAGGKILSVKIRECIGPIGFERTPAFDCSESSAQRQRWKRLIGELALPDLFVGARCIGDVPLTHEFDLVDPVDGNVPLIDESLFKTR